MAALLQLALLTCIGGTLCDESDVKKPAHASSRCPQADSPKRPRSGDVDAVLEQHTQTRNSVEKSKSPPTRRGHVRFIRLTHSGDGPLVKNFDASLANMLMQYGVRTRQPVAKKSETRTIAELDRFPLRRSPPVVFLTGHRTINASKADVEFLRRFLLKKHGMLFVDNASGLSFHRQFLAMMNRILPDVRPETIPLSDDFHQVPYRLKSIPFVAPHAGKEPLGWKVGERWVCYYHPGSIAAAWSDAHGGVRREVWESAYQLGTNVIFQSHVEYSRWLTGEKRQAKREVAPKENPSPKKSATDDLDRLLDRVLIDPQR